MTVITPTFPIEGPPIIRGDPFVTSIDFIDEAEDGTRTPINVSDWQWRAHVRRSYDAALITEFTVEVVTPEGGTVPNQVLMSLDCFQTQKLKTGMVFDLEQLIDNATPQTFYTWWIVEKIVVHKDVSHA